MPTLVAAKSANSAVELPHSVALFVGGTSGIGQASVEAFARYAKGNAHIIICGRNEKAAQEIFAKLPRSASSRYEFLQCDASRLANVTATCKRLKEEQGLRKLNYLFMSQGFFTLFGSFDDNGEGLDKKFCLHFYSRFKFVTELAPLLQAAKDAGEEARVVTVMGAGRGSRADLNDLGLRKTYSVIKMGLQCPTYNDLAVEAFAKKYPNMSFTHNYPGFVKTPILNSSWLVKVLGMIFSPLSTSPSDCAEWMLRPLLDPTMSQGAFHLDEKAEPYPASKLPLSESAETAIYDHFIDVSSKY